MQQDLRTYSLRRDWKVALERFDSVSRFQHEQWWLNRPVPFEWQENWVLSKLEEGFAEPWNHPEHPPMVVIDYAESRPDLRAMLMRLHSYQQREGAGRLRRVRLLLLARNAGDWWQFLRQSDTGLGAWLGMTRPCELAPLAISEAEREKVFHEAVQRFSEKLGRKPSGEPPPHFSDERFTRVLYLHMAALASVEELPFAADTLLDVILEHEERFWETSAR